jgi:glutamate dehydrogenase (NAD(P)+)
VQNAGKVKAKLIVEAANNPVTNLAEEMLFKRGILILPDFLVNAGGVIGSYVEYIGGNADEAFEMIDAKIRENTREVLERAINHETVTMPRVMGMRIAKERVAKAMQTRIDKN